MATNLSNLDGFFNNQDVSSNNKTQNDFICENITDILKQAQIRKISLSPVDIRRIVKDIFNIEIRETNLGKTISGFLERIGNNWYIYINKQESEVRKRFTIAHELGHFIYHRDKYVANGTSMPDQIFFRDDNTNPIEQQANNFAANLLMPEDVFKKYIKEGNNTLDKLADKFNLSTSAVKYRAYKLGLITEYE